MTPERYQQITQLYQAALELTPSQCPAFLAQACEGDEELRREVESLLAHDAESDGFLAAPALNVAAQLMAQEYQPLAPRQHINHYQVDSLLGKGGMGEVYLAEDTRLQRKVALKLLPAAFTQDADRVRRFKREALAASGLNHPNILTVFDLGESNGLQFIVTEYVEGQTLRQRLQQGRLPLSNVLDIAIQTASALEAAHRAGIVHRDIKPENIMARPDGLVKVLDFGLAKLLAKDEDENLKAAGGRHKEDKNKPPPDSRLPHHSTMPGRVMGTISYMSPEQALGQRVDERTDLFSLGVVLYEMLSGAPPFTGNSDAAIYDAILHQTPTPLRQSLPQLPAEVEWVLNRTLEKDCEVRYQTASDLKAALLALKRNSGSGEMAVNYTSAGSPPVPAVPKSWRRPTVLAAVALAVMALAGVWWWRGKQAAKPAALPPTATFARLTSHPGQELYPSLSPDGKLLVYAGDEAGNMDIWLQRVSGATPINLTRDSAVADTQPAFSPDGEQLAFRSERDGGGIFLMGATGENVRRLTSQGYNPAWSPDGQEIVYALGHFIDVPNNRSAPPSALHIINVQTGTTRRLTDNDGVQPHWSPHGQRIAYWGIHRGGQRDIWTISATGGTPVQVTTDGAVNWNPVWAPDGRHLYFASDRGGSMNLWRVPINEPTGQVQGAPEAVTTPATYSGFISFARDSQRLVYVESNYQVNLQEVAFDPVKLRVSGTPQWITRGARIATQQHLSPDQQWIAFDSLGNRQEDLFIVRRDGSGLRQLTNDPFKERTPRWSPDGTRIIFFTDRTGRYELWQINSDGSNAQQLTWTTGPQIQMPQWSPDGRIILCSMQPPTPPLLLDPALPWSQQTPQSLPAAGIPEGILVTSWSADGKKLLGTSQGILTYSFATQQYERLTASGVFPIWLNDNRHALFITTDKLNLLDTQTRQITEILSVAPRLLKFISVSQANRFISLSVDTTESDIWLATLTEFSTRK
jgi:Tol biopolymer transport system component/serine/threonine protein kinase